MIVRPPWQHPVVVGWIDRLYKLLIPQSKPGWPPLAKAARTCVAIVAPLAVLRALGLPDHALFAAIGGLLISFVDTGGTYQAKARYMFVATLLISASIFFSTLAGEGVWLAAISLGLVSFVFAFSVLFSPSMVMTGFVTTLAWLVGVGLPIAEGDRLASAILRLEGVALGGVWCMLLAIAIWPFRPYQPSVQAVSDLYRKLAELLQETTSAATATNTEQWEAQIVDLRSDVRCHLIEAEATLRSMRISSPTTSVTSRRLTALYSIAEQMFFKSLDVAESISMAQLIGGKKTDDPEHKLASLVAACQHSVLVTCDLLVQIANRLVDGTSAVDREAARRAAETFMKQVKAMRPHLESASGVREYLAIEQLAERNLYLAGIAADAAFNAMHLSDARRLPETEVKYLETDVHVSSWKRIKENLTFRSAAFRHALRLGATMGVGVLVYTALDVPKPFWITLAILSVVKPDLGGTLNQSIQTVAGTILGCSLAAILVALVESPWSIVFLIIPFAFAMMSLAYYNAALFAAGAAPIFVLLSDLSDMGDWQLALWRIGNTALGAVLGLVGGYLLWPRSEQEAWYESTERVLETASQYAGAVLGLFTGETSQKDPRAVEGAIVRALSNASAQTQRLLSEPVGDAKRRADIVMQVNTAALHIIDALHVLKLHSSKLPAGEAPDWLKRFRRDLTSALLLLAKNVHSSKAPDGLPDLDAHVAEVRRYAAAVTEKLATKSEADQAGSTATYETAKAYEVFARLAATTVRSIDVIKSALYEQDRVANSASAAHPA